MLDFLLEIGFEILISLAEFYYDLTRDDSFKIKVNRKKVLRFLRRHKDKSFTTEEIHIRVLKKLNVEGVLSVLNYLMDVEKVVKIKESTETNSEVIFWSYREKDFWA